jgi:GNAT superfamily N-acetyltransferase
MTWHLEVITQRRIQAFIDICEELWLQGSQVHLEFDRDVTRDLGFRCINNAFYFCQLAVDENDVVVGCMAGYVTKLIFSRNVIGNEEGLYVRSGVPDRAAIAAEMLRRFVRFCKDAGAVDVRTGVISNIDNYAADVFYRRNGFKRIGTIYSLRNPGGS